MQSAYFIASADWTVTFKKCLQVKSKKDINLVINTEITDLEHNKIYKYLGIN